MHKYETSHYNCTFVVRLYIFMAQKIGQWRSFGDKCTMSSEGPVSNEHC